MANIYISATHEDLVDQRKAVYEALLMMGHEVVAMEDYAATHMRPLEKCLQDVENCEVLVGIIAWRYGYRPPGETNPHNRSITELEIRCALEKKKTCLFFLLDEKEPWPPGMCDRGEDRKSVEALRDLLKKQYVVSYFRKCDSLAAQVIESVRRNVSVPPHPDIEKLLPRPFEGNFLSGERFRIFAEKLYYMVARTDFEPELIVGVNQGGTLAAAFLSRFYQSVPMGVVKTQKISSPGKKGVAYFSLPLLIRQAKAGVHTMGIKPNRLLVVDSKFKSGGSLVAVDSLLREKYGKDCDIRYGITLAYGGWDPNRWEVVEPSQPWHFKFHLFKNATSYVAYYTDIEPGQEIDPIREELRP